jgi:hypothetical protein
MNINTLVVDNFKGSMTYFSDGDINSGRSYSQNSAGQNPFIRPGNLTWVEAPVQIDAAGSVITDMILDGKERVENGILYVYAIGHTGRLYKIQVNDPTTFNPDYDNPVLLTTLTSGTPTFTRGGFIDFFGSTERIYIGHDKGVTRVDFAGTNETAISGTWTQTVPRPLQQFIGKLYIGNGSNIAEIDSTATQTFAAKLSPGFPDNTQVRDMDVTPDGTYLQMVVSRLPLPDQTSTTQDTTSPSNSDSFIFSWNGTDTGYTSFKTFPYFSLTANTMFQNYQYTFGYDQMGCAVYAPVEKILTVAESKSPPPNAIISMGNMVIFSTPLSYNGFMEVDFITWGSSDFEIGQPLGYYDLLFLNSTAPETDVIRTPYVMSVSNAGIGASSNGYANNVFGTSKIYFSTLETSSAPTTAYRLYKWKLNTAITVPQGDILIDAVYQTQTQLFSKKVTIKEVRVYGEPWVANNSFLIDLIGSAGTAITGGSKTFTAGSNLTIGDDFAWYTPDCAPTYAIGLMITNKGTVNHVINKVEIDYTIGGK